MKKLFIACSLSLMLSAPTFSQVLSDQIEQGGLLQLTVGVSGEVKEVLVAQGDRVNKGDVILRLNQAVFDSAFEAAVSLVKLRTSQVQLLQDDYARQQALYEEGSLSTVQLQESEVQWLEAQSRLASARHAKAQAEHDLALSVIRAPTDGEITAIALQGQRVNLQSGPTVLVKMSAQ